MSAGTCPSCGADIDAYRDEVSRLAKALQDDRDLLRAAAAILRSLANHAKPNRELGQNADVLDRDIASARACADELTERFRWSRGGAS